MGPRMFRLLLLGILTVLFMNKRDRVLTSKFYHFCNACHFFDGYQCLKPMKTCVKLKIPMRTMSCTTDHFYYYDRSREIYRFRYTVLSCRPCAEGSFQIYHDLVRETFCCTDGNQCNDPEKNEDIIKITEK